jgi:prolyl-tRNA synthetase
LEEKANEKGITAKKAENFSEWYPQVLTKSWFIDYTDVSGALVFLPAANAAWQMIMAHVDSEFRKLGIEDVYFPLFIPEKLLEKEKEHVKGFAPEVAWVTEAGNTKLDERLAIRPTSETIMYKSYSKWIRSWRDLPVRFNQWNNVVRWEFKHPTPLLRSREYLWNEGHTAFATQKEADAERDLILGIYEKTLRDYLALPGIVGRKSEKEKFAGALASYSIEHIMPDGWAIQGPDFHSDGQNFAKAFEIKFLDQDEKMSYVWQNTFAITTRELGVMVATHSDDKGLVLPPLVAYIQAVIVPIYKKDDNTVKKFSEKVFADLSKKVRIRLDDRDGYTPGFKFNEWELKGVPLRIEIGPKDVANNSVVLVRRDTGEKTQVPVSALDAKVPEALEKMQADLYKKASEFMKSNIHGVKNYDEFKETLKKKKGMIHAPWCGSQECEDKIKDETGAKITNIPFEQGKLGEKCIYCGKKAKEMANFARSY